MSKSKAPIERAGAAREVRDGKGRDEVEASFVPLLKARGMLVPDRIAYNPPAGFAESADGAPAAGRPEMNVGVHRAKNQPAGGHPDALVPFKNLKSGKE